MFSQECLEIVLGAAVKGINVVQYTLVCFDMLHLKIETEQTLRIAAHDASPFLLFPARDSIQADDILRDAQPRHLLTARLSILLGLS